MLVLQRRRLCQDRIPDLVKDYPWKGLWQEEKELSVSTRLLPMPELNRKASFEFEADKEAKVAIELSNEISIEAC